MAINNNFTKIADAQERYTLAPNTVLDTEVSVLEDSVDVRLVDTAVEQIVGEASSQRALWETLNSIESLEPQERAIVKRRLGEISLVACAAEQILLDVDNSDEIRSLEQELFDYYSPKLYYQAIAAKMRQIEELNLSSDLEYSRAVLLSELESLLPEEGLPESEDGPTEKTLSVVNEWLLDQFGDIIDEIDNDPREKFDATTITEYFQKAIDSTSFLKKYGWEAELITRQKSAVSVQAPRRRVVVPTQREMTKRELRRVTIHEVFGHALRSAMAEEFGIDVGRMGTATYARFEEAFLIALEQCLENKHDPIKGSEHYIATGLAVTDGKSREQVARILEHMSFLIESEKSDQKTAKKKALSKTKVYIRRTYPGMTDVDDDVVHRKDIDYYHGLSDSWKLLNFAVEHDVLDETMRWVLSAKFNPFDIAEREYVNRHVGMPLALEELLSE